MKQIIYCDSVLPLFSEALFLTPEQRKEKLPLSGNMGVAYKNGFVYLVKLDYRIKIDNIDKKKRYIKTINSNRNVLEILDYFSVSELKNRNKSFRRIFKKD
jgi:hypothetical protein